MTTAVLKPRTHQFDVEDIEYVRHGDKPLLARVFQPRGKGLVRIMSSRYRETLGSSAPPHPNNSVAGPCSSRTGLQSI